MTINNGLKIIGGMFGLLDPLQYHTEPPPFSCTRSLYLANARSGMMLLIERLAPEHTWVPSYFCNHMLQLLKSSQTGLRLYPISYDLTIASLDWIEFVMPGDLVLLTDYFGFHCDADIKKRIRERGAYVLEDASQALLSSRVGQDADFVLFSPRKFLGVPDGGILLITTDVPWSEPVLQQPPAAWWLKALAASLLRRDFDQQRTDDRYWFELFRETDHDSPVGAYAMSELSRLLLMHCVNYSEVAQRRISNYRCLADALGSCALFPHLPDGVVPLGFPIRLAQRDRIRAALFRHELYPPVHWPLQNLLPAEFEESLRLSADILTLPCDQRYDTADMARIITLVRKEASV